jgi:hypothetical protein
MVTRTRLVGKKWISSPQNGDEIAARRQKSAFIASKWRRECGSSTKKCSPRSKVVTRFGLVGKKQHSPSQIGDETKRGSQVPSFFHFPIFIISVTIKFA